MEYLHLQVATEEHHFFPSSLKHFNHTNVKGLAICPYQVHSMTFIFLIIIGPGHIYAWQTASAVTPDSTHLIHAILAGWGILACMQLLLNYAALYTNNIIIIIVSLH